MAKTTGQESELLSEVERLRCRVQELEGRETAKITRADAQLEALLDGLAIGVAVVDPEGRFVEANDAYCRIVGYSREELCRLTVFDITYPEDGRQMREDLGRLMGGEASLIRRDVHGTRKDGTSIWNDISGAALRDQNGSFLGAVGVVVDITERKLAEHSLRESEELYRALFESAADGCMLLEGDRFVDCNRAVLDLLDRSREQLIGQPPWRLSPPTQPDGRDSKSMALEQIQKALTGVPQAFEWRHQRPDGTPVDTDVRLYLVELENRRLLITTQRDITKRKRAEQEILASRERMRSLATELSVVEERDRRGFADYLHDQVGQELALLRMRADEIASTSDPDRISVVNQDVIRILEQMISETRSLTFDLSPPILYELGLAPAIEWLGKRIAEDHGLDFEFTDRCRSGEIDVDLVPLLYRAVRELLVNVAKHAEATRVKIEVTCDEQFIRIVVEDDGRGFDSSLPHAAARAAGFGLFSIRERLSLQDGVLEIESEPGKGTRATLEAPLLDGLERGSESNG